ncbi:hypothetical protein H5T87_09340 [bacterium]|nr:hypothetical protein [bacterium]
MDVRSCSLSILFLLLFLVPLKGQQLLINGDFEESLSGWSCGFYPQREDDITKCIRRSNKHAKTGKYSLEINTQSILGEEVTLVFNGAISQEANKYKGQRVILSGWVYIEKGTAVRPISVRFRTFGRDEQGNSGFLGDIFELKIIGKPGEWQRFQAIGYVPNKDITGMDLHCWISPDIVPTIQFLDDLRLESYNPPLEFTTLRQSLWQDELVIPVEVRINREGTTSLKFKLLNSKGAVISQWSKPPRSAIYGLNLKSSLPIGQYAIKAELRDGKGNLLSEAKTNIEVVASPWASAPTKLSRASTSFTTRELPSAFQVIGSKAPKEVPEEIPPQPEELSPDIDLSTYHKQGYVVFSRHYLETVSLKGRPRPGEISRTIRLFASPGEYEPFTLSIWALQPQKNVSIKVSDLVGEKFTLPSSNIDIRIVRSPQRLPTFLEKASPIDIPQDYTRTFWFTIYIPPNAPPGFYQGNIIVQTTSSQPTQLALLLRVLPIKLPPPQRGYGFWWGMDGRWKGYYSNEHTTVLEQIRRQFILLREYGCNMVSIGIMPKMKKINNEISYDFKTEHWAHCFYSLEDIFRIAKETKLFSPRVPIQYGGAESLHSWWIGREFQMDLSSDEFANFYRSACQTIDKWVKKQGFVLAFACVDEIGNSPDRRQEALRWYKLAKEAGVLTSVTDNSMHGGVHLMGQPRFDEIIDMRVYNFINQEMIDHTRKSGDSLWLYNLGSTGWYPKLDRFVYGFFTERCGADGYSQWAFQWPGSGADPYESAITGQHTGWHYALPAPDGPLPTLALEAVREGIDDARYLSLLPPNQRLSFLKDIQPLSTTIGEFLEKNSGYTFDARRWKIAITAMKTAR